MVQRNYENGKIISEYNYVNGVSEDTKVVVSKWSIKELREYKNNRLNNDYKECIQMVV